MRPVWRPCLAPTGVPDLSEATSLSLSVNTHEAGVSHLGPKLPALVELNLSHSVVESLRDLGTGFRVLQVGRVRTCVWWLWGEGEGCCACVHSNCCAFTCTCT